MVTDQQTSHTAPWYTRGKTHVVGAGAVAAAVLAVLALGDRLFPADLADMASIEWVAITKSTSLGDFASGGMGEQIVLGEAAEGASIVRPGRAEVAIRLPSLAATPVPPAPDRGQLAPPDKLLPTAAPSATAPAPSRTAVPAPGLQIPTEAQREALSASPALAPYAPVVRDNAGKALRRSSSTVVGDDPTFSDVESISAELRAALDAVESQTTADGLDPLGWTIAVDISLEGLDGVPLILTWSLDGTDVPLTWRADNLAYRIVASTPRDSGVAEIWVPDLKADGSYNVNVTLSYEEDGTIADLGTPLALPNG